MSNPLQTFLKGYGLASVDSWSRAVAAMQRRHCDLFLIHDPLGWAEPADICRRIRTGDAHTPIIVYSTMPSARDRRETLAAGAQAYVLRSDAAKNLAGTAGQLIMLAELRSMEALSTAGRAIQDAIVSGLKVGGHDPAATQARLKSDAYALFTNAGGNPANFDRMWPAIYADALGSLERDES